VGGKVRAPSWQAGGSLSGERSLATAPQCAAKDLNLEPWARPALILAGPLSACFSEAAQAATCRPEINSRGPAAALCFPPTSAVGPDKKNAPRPGRFFEDLSADRDELSCNLPHIIHPN